MDNVLKGLEFPCLKKADYTKPPSCFYIQYESIAGRMTSGGLTEVADKSVEFMSKTKPRKNGYPLCMHLVVQDSEARKYFDGFSMEGFTGQNYLQCSPHHILLLGLLDRLRTCTIM